MWHSPATTMEELAWTEKRRQSDPKHTFAYITCRVLQLHDKSAPKPHVGWVHRGNVTVDQLFPLSKRRGTEMRQAARFFTAETLKVETVRRDRERLKNSSDKDA